MKVRNHHNYELKENAVLDDLISEGLQVCHQQAHRALRSYSMVFIIWAEAVQYSPYTGMPHLDRKQV